MAESGRADETRSVRHVEAVMGTMVSIDLRAVEDEATAERGIREAVAWLHRVDEIFSTYKPDSAICRLQRGEQTLAACPPEVPEVLELAASCQRRTGGAFSLDWDGRGPDPTGMVKGWAAERASALLADLGLPVHSVNAAGDVRLRGTPEPGRAWSTGIAHPLLAGHLVAVVDVSDVGVATSGTAERAGHIVDPRTRGPAVAVASATVLGPDLGVADGYATAAVSLGDDAAELLASLDAEGWSSMVVFATGGLWVSQSFPGRVFPAGVKPALP